MGARTITRAQKAWGVLVGVMFAVALVPIIGITTQPQTANATTVYEQEPNDDFDQATSVAVGQKVRGQADESFNTWGNVGDFYEVNLPVTGAVTISFANEHAISGSHQTMSIRVYNKDCAEVTSWKAEIKNKQENKETVYLNKGVNYIGIAGGGLRVNVGQPYHFKITYSIDSTTLKKASSGSKKFTAKWTKASGASKYQIRYSTKKSMTKAKVVSVSNNAKSKKIKAKSGKKYYVQVRVVKTIGGKDYYSKWSNKKTVRVK